MIEKLIYLESVDLVEFLGIKNAKLELIKNHFPKLNIVARGNWLKAIGDAEEVADFEDKINLLLIHYHDYNVLTETSLNEILLGDRLTEASSKSDVILFSTNGKPIKARTENQDKLVKGFKKNDLLFAVGPAGSGKTYVAIALAVAALKNRKVRRIILSRPAVEAGEKLGFLPGDMKEKIDLCLVKYYTSIV